MLGYSNTAVSEHVETELENQVPNYVDIDELIRGAKARTQNTSDTYNFDDG